MEKFERHYTVRDNDVDDLQHMNNIRYLQLVQDMARDHWEHAVPEKLRENTIWVVRNHNITYKGQAFSGDRIRLETFVEETRGAISVRMVNFYDQNDYLLVQARTSWCLLDPQTLRPRMVGPEIADLFSGRGAK